MGTFLYFSFLHKITILANVKIMYFLQNYLHLQMIRDSIDIKRNITRFFFHQQNHLSHTRNPWNWKKIYYFFSFLNFLKCNFVVHSKMFFTTRNTTVQVVVHVRDKSVLFVKNWVLDPTRYFYKLIHYF